jgi:hypothetical protein
MVPIKWNNGEFFIDDNRETVIDTYSDNISLFSNRGDAVKFRKILGNIRTNFPESYSLLGDFFLEYSTAEEFEKFITKLKKLSVNKLFSESK